MSGYRLSGPATNDLTGIREYLVNEADVPVARYVLRELREAMRFLGKWPDAGHRRQDLTDEPLKFWPVFSYLIIYDPSPEPIEVVRVLRGARDVTAILDDADGEDDSGEP